MTSFVDWRKDKSPTGKPKVNDFKGRKNKKIYIDGGFWIEKLQFYQNLDKTPVLPKGDQTEVISRSLFTFIAHKLQKYLVVTVSWYNFILVSQLCRTNFESVYPITFWKYAQYPIKVLLKKSTCSFKNF